MTADEQDEQTDSGSAGHTTPHARLRARVAPRVAAAADRVRNRAGAASEGEVEDLQERVAALESEIQELRRMNVRLAELVDVVQELMYPVAKRDEAALDAAFEKFQRSL